MNTQNSKSTEYMQLDFIDETDPNKTRFDSQMLKIEKDASITELDQMKQRIKQSTELDDPEKHNLIVDVNIAQWERSRSKRIYSFVVLLLLTFS